MASIKPIPRILSGFMRRDRLLWFATGVACSAIVSISTRFVLPSNRNQDRWYIAVSEPALSGEASEDVTPWQSAKLFRDCGARQFEMIPEEEYSSDSLNFTQMALLKNNIPIVNCIIDRAPSVKMEARVYYGDGDMFTDNDQ